VPVLTCLYRPSPAGATPVSISTCASGFNMLIAANRSSNPGNYFAQCSLSVSLSQVILPPVIVNCNEARAVIERSPTGTAIGSALSATTNNVGTTITWAFSGAPPGLPFSIGLCDGQFKVMSAISWTQSTSWTVTVVATNNGAAINLGSASVSCPVTVAVVQSPLPPVLSVSQLYTVELLPQGECTCALYTVTCLWQYRFSSPFLCVPGAVTGSLNAVDPANYTVTNYTWAVRERVLSVLAERIFGTPPYRLLLQVADPNNNFNISNSGIVTVGTVVDTLGANFGPWSVYLLFRTFFLFTFSLAQLCLRTLGLISCLSATRTSVAGEFWCAFLNDWECCPHSIRHSLLSSSCAVMS
jgi:hypothetical protein